MNVYGTVVYMLLGTVRVCVYSSRCVLFLQKEGGGGGGSNQ